MVFFWVVLIVLAWFIEKTINEEETSNVDLAESMTDLKVCTLRLLLLLSIYEDFRTNLSNSTPRSEMHTSVKSWISNSSWR
jgi:hypothetical protein